MVLFSHRGAVEKNSHGLKGWSFVKLGTNEDLWSKGVMLITSLFKCRLVYKKYGLAPYTHCTQMRRNGSLLVFIVTVTCLLFADEDLSRNIRRYIWLCISLAELFNDISLSKQGTKTSTKTNGQNNQRLKPTLKPLFSLAFMACQSSTVNYKTWDV